MAPVPEPPPLGLYLHFPWCLKRCPYCDFNAYQSNQPPLMDYLKRMDEEMGQVSELCRQSPATVFIGGGTPSLLPATAVAQLLDGCARHLGLTSGAEITLEANPGALESCEPAEFQRAGVNRLSLGVQSFHDSSLKALGRIHSSHDALTALEQALNAGFERINLDLMYGLPGQNLAMALADLEQAVQTGIGHISWYQLTLEPNTYFWSHRPKLPEEEVLEAINEEGCALLQQAGFHRYEVSAWCRSGQECRHNLNYWTFGDYLGLGPGAHSKISGDDSVQRWAQLSHPQSWLRAVPATCVQHKQLHEEHLLFEFFLNAFRLYGKVDANLLYRRTGICAADSKVLDECLQRARVQGLMQAENWQPSGRGRRFLDDLTEIFLPKTATD